MTVGFSWGLATSSLTARVELHAHHPRGDNLRVPDSSDTTAAPGPDPLRVFRQSKHGLLRDDELLDKVRFVVDPCGGVIVLPLPGVPVSETLTLLVPDESDDSMQLLIDAAELDRSRDDLCDRWRIYHGSPDSTRWFTLRPDSVKWEGRVYDGSEITQPTSFASAEARLCKLANADRPRLARVCQRLLRVAPAEPLVVGVDPDGVDLRARFGITRLEFPTRAADAAAAEQMLAALLAE